MTVGRAINCTSLCNTAVSPTVKPLVFANFLAPNMTSVYAGVAEHSVYVAAEARGRGAGRELLAALVASSERGGIWTLESGIFPENEASLALHRALGFRVVGVRERLGRMRGVWRDVLLLERRSEVIA